MGAPVARARWAGPAPNCTRPQRKSTSALRSLKETSMTIPTISFRLSARLTCSATARSLFNTKRHPWWMTNFAEATPEVERACGEVVHDMDVMAGVGDQPLDHMASEETKAS